MLSMSYMLWSPYVAILSEVIYGGYTGLLQMIVGVLTTCHTQYTSDSNICIFLFNRKTLTSFCYIPYRCSICAPFVILQTST